MKERFRIIIYVLFILIILIIGVQSSLAWSGETHQYLCLKDYNYNGDCTRADWNHTPSAYYHHCTDNAPLCYARLEAEEYKNDLDIKYHLLEDAKCPAHHFSLQSADHSKFEDCVNKHIINKDVLWACDYLFIDKSGVQRHLFVDQDFDTEQPLLETHENNFISDFINSIIEFIRSLFK